MKKIMIFVLCTTFSASVFAQKSALQATKSFLKQFEYTVSVGIGSTVSSAPYDEAVTNFNFGVNVKKDFLHFKNEKMSLYGLVGLHFTQRGGQMSSLLDGAGSASGNDYRETQFNIPLHVGLKYKFKNNWFVFADAGPFIGINGSAKLGSGYGHNDYVLDSKPLDFGIGGNIGVCFKKFGISFGVDKGFLTIAKFSSEEKNMSEDLKASCFYMKLQWTFNKQ